jgi:protein-tyrosine phosphatase
MNAILFVCTGNIFRSLIAEYALKSHLTGQAAQLVGSAGIEATPQTIHPAVRLRLQLKGADPSGHVQRKLTKDMLGAAILTVAMGIDHQAFIRREFGREVPLFNQICFDRAESILDVHEAVPDWMNNLEESRIYLDSVIEHIWAGVPRLLAYLPYR